MLRILAVCTANISRSPAVERLLRAGLDDTVQVGSAGVAALVGSPIDPIVATYLRARGVDPAGFAARQVEAPLLASTDLVLTLTRAHRTQVLDVSPSAVRRTFTLREFARVIDSLDLSGLPTHSSPGERLAAIVPLATAGRALAPRPEQGGDDVPDPHGRGAAAYDHSLQLIADATDVIARIARG